MCALTLTALNPFPFNPPAGTGEPAAPAVAPADAPAAGAATIDLLGITGLRGHISRTTRTDSGTGQTSVEDPSAVTLACEASSAHAADPNILFVFAGDSVGGLAYVSSIPQDRPTMEALNTMSLDVSALGNRELGQGLIDLETRILPASNSSILTANVSGSTPLSAKGGGKGTFIKKIDGVHVGLVGVVTGELPTLVSSPALSTLALSLTITATNAYATELKDDDPASGEANVVVILSYEDAASTTTSFSKNVNTVFSGHTHVPFAETVTDAKGNQIAVIQTNHYGWALGRIRLSYDPADRKTSVIGTNNKDLRNSSCTTNACGVTGIVSQAEENSAVEGGKPLAKISSDFLCDSDGSGPGANRGTEPTAPNLIAESFHSWLAADTQPTDFTRYIGIVNPGDVRADLLYAVSGSEDDGVLTSGEAYTAQPFGNEMAYTILTGAELKTLLSQQWQPDSSRPILTLGLSRNIDALTKATTSPGYGGETEAAPTARKVLVNDKPLADGDSAVIASNSSLLTGGNGYTVLRDKPVTNTGVFNRDVTSVYLVSFGDKPVTADYSKRQTAITVGSVYISSDGARSTDTVSVTLDSLAYTNPTEQVAGARRVRVSTRDKEILTKSLDLTANPTSPTTGRVDFSPTFLVNALTRACRTVQAATYCWALVETLNAVGMILNRFLIEIEGEDAVGPGANSGDSAATGADVAADGAGGKAASTPQSDPGTGEISVDNGTESSAGSGAQPAATTAPAASGAPVRAAKPKRPNQVVSDSPLVLAGASLSMGALALALLVVGGYLILHRRQQVV